MNHIDFLKFIITAIVELTPLLRFKVVQSEMLKFAISCSISVAASLVSSAYDRG